MNKRTDPLTQAARELLDDSLKHARTAALAGALVPLGAVGVEAGECCGTTDNTSRVAATVADLSGTGVGPYLYEFEVFNTSDFFPSGSGAALNSANGGLIPVIVDWELPFFDLGDLDESSITSPAGWTYSIEDDSDAIVPPNNEDVWTYDASTDPTLQDDPELYGPNPEVFEDPPFIIHWYLEPEGDFNGIFPDDSLDGFGFESVYSSQAAPYQSSWQFFPQNTGDPPIPGRGFGTPNSPARQQAQIPEPASALLAGLGLLTLSAGFGGRSRDDRLATFVADTEDGE